MNERLTHLCGGLMLASMVATPAIYCDAAPGEGKRQRRGVFVKRPMHDATIAKPKSSSLKRMLGKAPRRSA